LRGWSSSCPSWHASVSSIAIHEVQQRLACLEPPQVLREQIDNGIPVIHAETGGVRRDEHVRQRPQRAGRGERLPGEDVEGGPAQMSASQRRGEGILVDQLT